MTATINASTSSGVIVTSDTSGSLDIQSNGTSRLSVTSSGVSFTSAATAVPTFCAYLTANATVTANTFVKIPFNATLFDTNSNFNTTTNRFLPTVAGYYQINLIASNTAGTVLVAAIYKNGTIYQRGSQVDATSGQYGAQLSLIIYFNGTTDYIEGWTYSSLTTINGGAPGTGLSCNFSGAMVRSA